MECPKDPIHLCKVVKPPAGMFWLRLHRFLINYEERWSPWHWFKDWCGITTGRPWEIYHIIVFAVLVLVLLLVHALTREWIVLFAVVVATISIIDLVLDFTSVSFVTRYPADALRSVILVMSGFVRFCIAWAIFYSSVSSLIDNQFSEKLSFVSSIYFSIVTVTTIGFGDIWAKEDIARALIYLHILVGLYVLAAILTVVLYWVNERPSRPKPMPLTGALTIDDDGGV